jgi:hypothetical protein
MPLSPKMRANLSSFPRKTLLKISREGGGTAAEVSREDATAAPEKPEGIAADTSEELDATNVLPTLKDVPPISEEEGPTLPGEDVLHTSKEEEL